MQYYKINEGLEKVQTIEEADFIITKGLNKIERQNFLSKYHLPADIFQLDDIAPIAPRVEIIDKHENDDIIDTMIVILSGVYQTGKDNVVENRLETLTFVFVYDQLFLFLEEHSGLADRLLDRYGERIKNNESIIFYMSLILSDKFSRELASQKEMIDYLHEEAKTNTKQEILEELAETERNLVFLEHTLDTQTEVLNLLLRNQDFVNRVNNRSLTYDVKWYSRQVNKLVHLYQDLVQTVGSMITDLMSGQLNKIAKVLNSVSIIIAVGSLIVGYFGINTGGLLWMEDGRGSLNVILLILGASLITYLFLRNIDK